MMAWLTEIWSLLCESGPYLLVGFFLAGLLKVLIPERWILRHLGSNSFGAVAKAALVGLLLLGHIIAILARRGAPPTDTDPAS